MPTASAALFCILLAGCDRGSSASERASSSSQPRAESETASSETPTKAGTAAVVGAQPAGPAITETLDAAGITVERLAGGAVRVHGQDRWGVHFDSTYADATYFANAAPVLGRALTEAQARALVALVPRVQAPAAP